MKQFNGSLLATLLLVMTVTWSMASTEALDDDGTDVYLRFESDQDVQRQAAENVAYDLIKAILQPRRYSDLPQPNSLVRKRGLDLGLSRGFSGSQAGKHLMGLSLARFANGPGK